MGTVTLDPVLRLQRTEVMDDGSTGLCALQLKERSDRSQSEIHNRNNYCPRAVSLEIHDIHAVLT